MKRHARELTAAFFVLIVLAPVLYHLEPIYMGTPDIQYVRAKILWVLDGYLYTDPVTGYVNFHPPFYHLILSLFVRLGLSIETLLLITAIGNTVLTILTSHLVLRRVFGPIEAFWGVLLFPFMVVFMGFGNMFLASSFQFSVPLYLTGLWLYLKPDRRPGETILVSVFWGIAFLFSPVYFFLIGFTFVYEVFIRKRYFRSGLMVAVFAVMIIPFVVQAITVYRAGMADTGTFAFWRGVPDLEWLGDLATHIVSPVERLPLSWPAALTAAFLALGGVGIWKRRSTCPFPIIAALAFLFTAYHFNFQYATRIQYFLSLFLVASTVRYLKTLPIHRFIIPVLLCVVAGVGVLDHYIRVGRLYDLRQENLTYYQDRYRPLKEHLPELIEPGAYVLATGQTYRYFILPFYRAHGLVAYQSGEYFQINRDTSQAMLRDYSRMMETTSIALLEHLCEKYGIATCIVRREFESDRPGFVTIGRHWNEVYRDSFFTVYRKPAVGPH